MTSTDRSLFAQQPNEWFTPNGVAGQSRLRISSIPANADLRVRLKLQGVTAYVSSTWFPAEYLHQLHDLSTVAGGQSAPGRNLRGFGGQGPSARPVAEVMAGASEVTFFASPNSVQVDVRGNNYLYLGQWSGDLTLGSDHNANWIAGSEIELWIREYTAG